jgi:hypothetical protein
MNEKEKRDKRSIVRALYFTTAEYLNDVQLEYLFQRTNIFHKLAIKNFIPKYPNRKKCRMRNWEKAIFITIPKGDRAGYLVSYMRDMYGAHEEEVSMGEMVETFAPIVIGENNQYKWPWEEDPEFVEKYANPDNE